jgi:hypothetical protein
MPVDGPADVDLSQFSVSVALVLEGGGEPVTGDYRAANWVNGEAALLVASGDFAPGEYMAYVRVVAPPEDVRLVSGRVRVGDDRT